MDNLPGLPGDPNSMTPAVRVAYRNQLRFRPRAWLSAESGPFRVYFRVADEFREYPTLHTPRRERAYCFPDELFVDNLYLEGRGLQIPIPGVESVDFRIGRQDMMERGSVFGLDRVLVDGTPTDGSRNFYSDMARATLRFDKEKSLDAFVLYDSGRSDLRWGNRQSRGRSMNNVSALDSNDLDEWGGGLVYSQDAFGGQVPVKAYAVGKRTTSHVALRPSPRRVSAREVATFGVLASPRISESWDLELEAAQQAGRIVDSGSFAGGTMAFASVNRRFGSSRESAPAVSWATTFYSGDSGRTRDGAADRAWDPVWARYTQDSEMLVYGSLYENCWWTNMIYTKLKLSVPFGPRHSLCAYSGPMFAAVRDGLGREDGGGSAFRGVLTAVRYDFPIRLAPDGAEGFERFEVFGHVVGELFNPGGYYDSDRPAFFVRWQLDFRF